MKVSLLVTISDVIEVDSEHYTTDTPEEIAKEQLGYVLEGACDPHEMIGLGDHYECTIVVVDLK